MSQREIAIASRFPKLIYDEGKVRSLFVWLDTHSGLSISEGELSIAFLHDGELAELHEQFLNDPAPTDVITFPGEQDDGTAGEICISIDRGFSEAMKQSTPFSTELTLYLVHGWLHLAGYDDNLYKERKQMKAKEGEIMKRLKEVGMIPSFKMSS